MTERDENFERALLRADIRAGNTEAAKMQRALMESGRTYRLTDEGEWVPAIPIAEPRSWRWWRKMGFMR